MRDLTLFAYGTLQPGQRYWPDIEPFVQLHQPAELAGFSMWHLPAGYPAIASGPGVVRGTLVTFHPHLAAEAWRVCDRIEVASPEGDEPPLYQRRVVRATHWAIGIPRAERTQTYVLHPDRRDLLEQGAAPVPRGDWLAFWTR